MKYFIFVLVIAGLYFFVGDKLFLTEDSLSQNSSTQKKVQSVKGIPNLKVTRSVAEHTSALKNQKKTILDKPHYVPVKKSRVDEKLPPIDFFQNPVANLPVRQDLLSANPNDLGKEIEDYYPGKSHIGEDISADVESFIERNKYTEENSIDEGVTEEISLDFSDDTSKESGTGDVLEPKEVGEFIPAPNLLESFSEKSEPIAKEIGEVIPVELDNALQ